MRGKTDEGSGWGDRRGRGRERSGSQYRGKCLLPAELGCGGALRDSPTPYTCPWKGRAQYHDVVVGELALRDGAWSYPNIKESAATRVGRDFSGYVAFDVRQVRIEN